MSKVYHKAFILLIVLIGSAFNVIATDTLGLKGEWTLIPDESAPIWICSVIYLLFKRWEAFYFV